MRFKFVLLGVLIGASGTLFAWNKNESENKLEGNLPGENCEDRKTFIACLVPA
ncbi:MAG: hypothetical protein AB8G05_01205 [Oligoflexales bacterium]